MNPIQVMAVQMETVADKMENIRTAERMIGESREESLDFVVLPEMFNCPYVVTNFPLYAEPEGGPCWQELSRIAREQQVYLIAGSIPEQGEDGAVYNTSFVFDRSGNQIARHRKMHLFEVHIEGKQSFREADTLTGGDAYTVFDTEFGPMGVAICFDLRFPELFRLMGSQGAKAIFVPAAFNMTTGPAHWELTFRARAMDHQVYFVGCAPSRETKGSYVSWGHSIITNPWGAVQQQLEEGTGVLKGELDLDFEQGVRNQLPILKTRRTDLYKVAFLKDGL